MPSKEEIEKAKLYKSEYMQIPVTILTKENLDKLEEHCKKTIRIERGVEHSVVLELLYKYRELEVDKQKLIEKLKEDSSDGFIEEHKGNHEIVLKQKVKPVRQYIKQELLPFVKGEKKK